MFLKFFSTVMIIINFVFGMVFVGRACSVVILVWWITRACTRVDKHVFYSKLCLFIFCDSWNRGNCDGSYIRREKEYVAEDVGVNWFDSRQLKSLEKYQAAVGWLHQSRISPHRNCRPNCPSTSSQRKKQYYQCKAVLTLVKEALMWKQPWPDQPILFTRTGGGNKIIKARQSYGNRWHPNWTNQTVRTQHPQMAAEVLQ